MLFERLYNEPVHITCVKIVQVLIQNIPSKNKTKTNFNLFKQFNTEK